jgi:hypothetical protein
MPDNTYKSKNTFGFDVIDKDIYAVLRTFKAMDKIASEDLRKVATELAQEAADAIQNAASFNGRQASALASTIKVARDRIPKITIGGEQSITSSGAKAGDILIGAEFGSYRYKQFPTRSPQSPTGKGNLGYFIFPTLKMLQPRIKAKWVEGIDKIREEWKGRAVSG